MPSWILGNCVCFCMFFHAYITDTNSTFFLWTPSCAASTAAHTQMPAQKAELLRFHLDLSLCVSGGRGRPVLPSAAPAVPSSWRLWTGLCGLCAPHRHALQVCMCVHIQGKRGCKVIPLNGCGHYLPSWQWASVSLVIIKKGEFSQCHSSNIIHCHYIKAGSLQLFIIWSPQDNWQWCMAVEHWAAANTVKKVTKGRVFLPSSVSHPEISPVFPC